MVKKKHRVIAVMLCLMLFLQNIPLTVFADEGGTLLNTIFSEGIAETDVSEPDDEAFIEGINFSTKRLLVGTEDSSVLMPDANILSAYEGVYLLGFENEAEAKTAYTYYSSTAEFVESDIALFVADDSYAEKADESDTDAVSQIDPKNEEKIEYSLALIDTGAEEAVTSISVLGESSKDDNGHGTAMLNAIKEIAPDSTVLSVKAFDSHGVGSISSVYSAMLYAISQNVKVIVLPFAAESTSESDVLNRAVSMAKEKGIIIVGAAGNNNADAAGYLPGRIDGIYIAGACDKTGVKLPASNYGENVFCNAAAESTSKAAAKLAALIAAYGLDYLEAAMDNGILFRCDKATSETTEESQSLPEEETPLQEGKTQSLLDESELTENTLTLIHNGFTPIASDSEEEENVPTQGPITEDNVTIEYINIRWNTKSTDSTTPAGFDKLELSPDTEEVATQQFQIDFALSGQESYAPGSIEIAFPASIWENRYDKECGTLTLSVPEDPETGAEFAWKRDGAMIVITNVKTLPAASKFMLQGSFRDLYAPDMKDDTFSDLLKARITVVTPKNQKTISLDSNQIQAHIDTSVAVNYAFKTAHDTMNGTYDLWWGEIPKDMPEELLSALPEDAVPEDYGFIRWYAAGGAGGSQPFEMYIDDEIDNSFDPTSACKGIMLGISIGDTCRISENRKSIHELLFNGYDTKPKVAYIWTAYPKENFPEEEEMTTIKNHQEITVTGWDDKESTSQGADAEVKTKKPIDYTFVKNWDDKNNAEGHRPDSMILNIYCEEISEKEVWKRIKLTEEDAAAEDGNNWTYHWSDNGQGYTFRVTEEVSAKGILEDQYGEDHNQLSWSYYLVNYPNGEYDSAAHTWTFTNRYTEGWGTLPISMITKARTNAFADSELVSKADSLSLNKLMRDEPVEVSYDITSTVSAAAWYIERQTPNLFILEDADYVLDDNQNLTVDDISVGTVTFRSMPKLYGYDLEEASEHGYTAIEVKNPPPTYVLGKINGVWRVMAVLTGGTLTAESGSGAKVEGLKVILPDGVQSVKVQTEADGAYMNYSCTISIRLHPTQKMKEHLQSRFELSDYIRSVLFNQAEVYAESESAPGEKYESKSDYSYGYLHGRAYKTAAEMNKTFTLGRSDTVNELAELHSVLELIQQSNILSEEDYLEAVDLGEIPNTRAGTFYDLLPYGIDPDLSTITLSEGDNLVNAYTIPNYRNSGRTMLVAQVSFTDHLSYSKPHEGYVYTSEAHPDSATYPVEGYKNTHTLEFDSYISWEVAKDSSFDLTNVRNIAAYEAAEGKIGSVEQWEGEPDNPNDGQHNLSRTHILDDEVDWMTDLNPDHDNPAFVYAGAKLKADMIDSKARTSITKKVQIAGSKKWSDGRKNDINVQEGGLYSYLLTIVSDTDTVTSDIVLLDSLENYKPNENDDANKGDNQWRGTLLSIDWTSVIKHGIKPVLYYNTTPDLDITNYGAAKPNADELIDILIENGWKACEDINNLPSGITAIAFDLRKKTDGGEFRLESNEMMTIKLNMRAPYDTTNDHPDYFKDRNGKDTDGKDYMQNAHAYNQIFMGCKQLVKSGTQESAYINFSYTKVGIYVKSVDVEKVWDDDDDRDGIRPAAIRVTIHGDEDNQNIERTIELNEDNHWTGSFERLRTYDDEGNLITYTYDEEFVNSNNQDKYTSSTTRQFLPDGSMKIILTNTHGPEKISIPVTKIWDDEGYANNRPSEVVFRLYADGKFTAKEVKLRADSDGNWKGEFTDLDKYRNHGELIKYEIVEMPVDNYVQGDVLFDEAVPENGYTVTNIYQPYGSLIVSKIVKDAIAHDVAFTFNLNLKVIVTNDSGMEEEHPVTGQYDYVIYNSDDSEDSTGKIGDGGEFALMEGQRIEILELPINVNYEITERSSAGYELTDVVNDTGIITSWTPSEAEFTNTYLARGYAQITAQKFLFGRELNAYQFRFELLEADEDWNEGNLVRNGYNDKNGNISFGRIGYTNADHGRTYRYIIKEYIQKLDGYKYDEAIYRVQITPKDNSNGTMNCKIDYLNAEGNPISVPVNGENYDTPVFRNNYEAEGEIALRAWKTVNGASIDGEKFEFKLYDEEMKPVEGASVTNDTKGIIDFPELKYTQEDIGKTYRYYAREVNDHQNGIIYDTGIICYIVEIIDNGNGTLSFNQSSYRLEEPCEGENPCLICKGTGIKLPDADWMPSDPSDVPLFTNGLADGSLSINKTVTGSKPPKDEFTFTVMLIGDKMENLTEIKDSTGKSYPITDNQFTCTLTADQTLTFNDLPAGTVYQITENDLPKGWALSNMENASGVIPSADTAKAVFTNLYQPDQTAATIVGVKYFDNKPAGQDAEGDSFRFALMEIDADGNQIGEVEEIEAQSGGLIQFNVIYETEDLGTHYYKVYEIAGSNSDIKYDTHEEDVTVEVTEKEGFLYAKVTYDDDQISFDNISIPGSLEISKTGLGMSENAESPLFHYTVKFYNENGIPVSGENISWYVKNTLTGEPVAEPAVDPENPAPEPVEPENENQGNIRKVQTNPGSYVNTYADGLPVSGVSGTISWSIDEAGKLTIAPAAGNAAGTLSGKPWSSYNSQITEIYVEPGVRTTACSSLFKDMTNLVSADLSNLDVTGTVNMWAMFHGSTKLEEVKGLENWNVSTVTNMDSMFSNCQKLVLPDLSGWDTSKVTTMYMMFWNCDAMIDFSFLKSWKFTNVTNMGYMFKESHNIQKIDLSGISSSEKLTSLWCAFYGCTSLTEIKGLENLDTSKVTNMADVFNGCSKISDFSFLKNWTTDNVTDMSSMFRGCSKLTLADINLDWNTSKVTNMSYTFANCTGIESFEFLMDNWDVRQVTNTAGLFQNCNQLTDLSYLSRWETTGKITNMSSMFQGCSKLESAEFLEGWEVGKVTNMASMFNGCSALTSLDLSGWDASSVTTMQSMFDSCSKLETINLNGMPLGKVTNMYRTFYNCTLLTEIEGVENLNVASVNRFDDTFRACKSITKLNLSNWDVSSAAGNGFMNMFFDMTGLKELNLSGWEINSKGASMYAMFYNCSNLENLDVSGWNTTSVNNFGNIFYNVSKINKISLDAGFFANTNTPDFNNPSSTAPYSGYWILEGEENELNPINVYKGTAGLREALLSGEAQAGTYVWQKSTYSVYFNPNAEDVSGSMSPMRIPVHDNEDYTIVNKYLRYGYKFIGWKDQDGREFPDGVIPKGTYKANDTVTLTAMWERISEKDAVLIYIDYYWEDPDKQGEYVLFDAMPVKTAYGVTLTLEAKEITGLFPSENYPSTISIEVTQEAVASAKQNSKDGYAHMGNFYYDHIYYTIHFEDNGADFGSMEDKEMVGGIDEALGNGFTKTGHAFLGWNTEEDGSGESYSDVIPVSLPAEDNEMIILYAQWLKIDQSVTPSAGEITVFCRAGETIVIPDLPAGTTYEIMEIDIPNGWTLVSDENVEGTIRSGESANENIINSYSARGVATVTMHKQFIGATLTSGEFSFEMSANDQFKDELTFEQSYDSTADENADILIPGAKSITVELTKYTINESGTVTVSGAGNEKLTALTGSSSTWKSESIVGNSIHFEMSPDVTEFTYTAKITATYDAPLTAANSILDENEEQFDDDGNVMTNPWFNTASILFDGLEFTQAGDYTFYIREVIPEDEEESDIEYDTVIREVIIRMTDAGNGSLNAEVIYEDTPEGQLFTNEMKKGDLEVTKVLEGAVGTAAEKAFDFTVYLTDASGMALNGEYTIMKKIRKAVVPDEKPEEFPEAPEGDVVEEEIPEDEFEVITDTIKIEEGYGKFTLKDGETITIQNLPHGAEYYVTEEDADYFEKINSVNEDGEIIGDKVQEVAFTNIYVTSDVLILKAKKIFKGGMIEDGRFAFKLLENAENGATLQTVYADSDGEVTFVIDYDTTAVGKDFIYYIQEVVDETDGSVQYDQHSVKVNVHVEQNEETHELVIKAEYEGELEFTNTALFDLEISKEVTGISGDWTKAFHFTFSLEANQDDLLPDVITCSKGEEQDTFTPEIGSPYTFTLKHGETMIFSGLPYGTKYQVTEVPDANYDVIITADEELTEISGGTVSGSMTQNISIAYENACTNPGILPGTGYSGGAEWYWRFGILLMLSGGWLYYCKRRRCA